MLVVILVATLLAHEFGTVVFLSMWFVVVDCFYFLLLLLLLSVIYPMAAIFVGITEGFNWSSKSKHRGTWPCQYEQRISDHVLCILNLMSRSETTDQNRFCITKNTPNIAQKQ